MWAPGDDRMYVVELYTGKIRIVDDGDAATAPYLDIRGKILAGGERGLLGLAFHPEYDSNGRFFVNYTDTAGDTVVEEYARSSANPDAANAASAQLVLKVAQPASNHNGGHLAFGPDGFLYIGLGDGGGGGDPLGNGQDPSTALGSMPAHRRRQRRSVRRASGQSEHRERARRHVGVRSSEPLALFLRCGHR